MCEQFTFRTRQKREERNKYNYLKLINNPHNFFQFLSDFMNGEEKYFSFIKVLHSFSPMNETFDKRRSNEIDLISSSMATQHSVQFPWNRSVASSGKTFSIHKLWLSLNELPINCRKIKWCQLSVHPLCKTISFKIQSKNVNCNIFILEWGEKR